MNDSANRLRQSIYLSSIRCIFSRCFFVSDLIPIVGKTKSRSFSFSYRSLFHFAFSSVPIGERQHVRRLLVYTVKSTMN